MTAARTTARALAASTPSLLASPVPSLRPLARRGKSLSKTHPFLLAAAATTAALVVTALINRRLAKSAERANPPAGQFMDVDGVRLHYVERGTGMPLVLLHGNGSMIQDFASSGLIDLAAQNYRVIAFDRPGFGHSDRPRNVVWTPTAQAGLIKSALDRLGVSEAFVLLEQRPPAAVPASHPNR